MVDPLVVGFVGRHGIGKSTLAHRLAARLAPNAFVAPFAWALREKLSSILPRILISEKQHPFEREALVFVGEEWRKVDPNYWVQIWRDEMVERVLECGNCLRAVVIVDDVYHHNEAAECDILIHFTAWMPFPSGYVPVSRWETEQMLAEGRADLTFVHPFQEGVEEAIYKLIEERRGS